MDLVEVGKTGRPHGLNGELKLRIKEAFEDDVLDARVVFLTTAGRAVPHFVEYIRGGGSPILKIEKVDSREAARLLVDLPVSLRAEDVADPAADAPHPFFRFEGYELEDVENGPIGRVKEVVEMPQHYMLLVMYRGRPLMVPLHEDLIVEADETKRRLRMQLPEGLLEL